MKGKIFIFLICLCVLFGGCGSKQEVYSVEEFLDDGFCIISLDTKISPEQFKSKYKDAKLTSKQEEYYKSALKTIELFHNTNDDENISKEWEKEYNKTIKMYNELMEVE